MSYMCTNATDKVTFKPLTHLINFRSGAVSSISPSIANKLATLVDGMSMSSRLKMFSTLFSSTQATTCSIQLYVFLPSLNCASISTNDRVRFYGLC